jgi:hypothetical protein
VREEGTSVHRVLFFGAVRASSIQEVRGSRRNARYERHKKELCSFFAFSYYTELLVPWQRCCSCYVLHAPVRVRLRMPQNGMALRSSCLSHRNFAGYRPYVVPTFAWAYPGTVADSFSEFGWGLASPQFHKQPGMPTSCEFAHFPWHHI